MTRRGVATLNASVTYEGATLLITPEKTKNIKKIRDHGGRKKQTAYGVRLKD